MNTTADDGLEKFPEAGSAANIGIMLVRKAALGLAKVCKRFTASQNINVLDERLVTQHY